MKQSTTHSLQLAAFFTIGIAAVGTAGFYIHPVAGLIWIGIVAFLLTWAACECRKDAIKAEESEKEINQ